jgi:hypothetical protein
MNRRDGGKLLTHRVQKLGMLPAKFFSRSPLTLLASYFPAVQQLFEGCHFGHLGSFADSAAFISSGISP